MARHPGILLLATLILSPCAALATPTTTLTFTPDPVDLHDLDHSWVYEWGIDVPLDPGQSVVAATLTFNYIHNWDSSANFLYVHQLDWAELGVTEIFDDGQGGDYFVNDYTGTHTHLVTYVDIPHAPQDLVYTFSNDDLVTLNDYLSDGRYGLGFDPDCHFYNAGVHLALTVVPEPASLCLLGIGFLLLRRR